MRLLVSIGAASLSFVTLAAQQTPPIRQMLQMGIPLGAGTDATRVASYNPWVSLYWLVSGKTVGGTALYPEANRLDRLEALRQYTLGSAWFSGEEGKKGAIVPGQLADLAVLSADFFSVPEEGIKAIDSVLTMVGGRVVYAAGEFERLGPQPLPASPGWSPVVKYDGYAQPPRRPVALHSHSCSKQDRALARARAPFWGAIGCDCFAF